MSCSANVFRSSFIHQVVDKETKFYLIKGNQNDFDYLKMFGFHDFHGGRLYGEYFYVLLDTKWIINKTSEEDFLKDNIIDVSKSIDLNEFTKIFLRENKQLKVFNNYNIETHDLIESPLILALFFDSLNNIISYQRFIFGNKESIQKYLPYSDGKAISYVTKGYSYWLLTDDKTGNFLLFLQEENNYKSIINEQIHLQNAKALASL